MNVNIDELKLKYPYQELKYKDKTVLFFNHNIHFKGIEEDMVKKLNHRGLFILNQDGEVIWDMDIAGIRPHHTCEGIWSSEDENGKLNFQSFLGMRFTIDLNDMSLSQIMTK